MGSGTELLGILSLLGCHALLSHHLALPIPDSSRKAGNFFCWTSKSAEHLSYFSFYFLAVAQIVVLVEDSFQLSVFSKKKKNLSSSLLSRLQQDAGRSAAPQRDVSISSREPGGLISPEPSVVLLGFHSQSNSGVQNNCYRGKMCLITGSSTRTMEVFQSIFLGQKKKSI